MTGRDAAALAKRQRFETTCAALAAFHLRRSCSGDCGESQQGTSWAHCMVLCALPGSAPCISRRPLIPHQEKLVVPCQKRMPALAHLLPMGLYLLVGRLRRSHAQPIKTVLVQSPHHIQANRRLESINGHALPTPCTPLSTRLGSRRRSCPACGPYPCPSTRACTAWPALAGSAIRCGIGRSHEYDQRHRDCSMRSWNRKPQRSHPVLLELPLPRNHLQRFHSRPFDDRPPLRRRDRLRLDELRQPLRGPAQSSMTHAVTGGHTRTLYDPHLPLQSLGAFVSSPRTWCRVPRSPQALAGRSQPTAAPPLALPAQLTARHSRQMQRLWTDQVDAPSARLSGNVGWFSALDPAKPTAVGSRDVRDRNDAG